MFRGHQGAAVPARWERGGTASRLEADPSGGFHRAAAPAGDGADRSGRRYELLRRDGSVCDQGAAVGRVSPPPAGGTGTGFGDYPGAGGLASAEGRRLYQLTKGEAAMPITEAELKKRLKEGLAPLYFLYGEECYLTAHYAAQIAEKAVGKDDMGGFNLQKLDGQSVSFDQIEEAVEALPLMAERKCVVIRDFDVAAAGAAQERLLNLAGDPPESCVTVFWQDAVQPDLKKNAKWKAFAAAVEKTGLCVQFPRKTTGDIVKLLVSGAARRGSALTPDNAKLLVERCGDDLNLLLNEIDKLSALAGGGEITREHIETAATKNLEASVFDLSKALLQNNYERSYTILNTLFYQKEEPVAILAVLSGAYADLYRAKAAAQAGVPAESLAADFGYRGREWRLRNAARDSARLSLPMLRQSLEILAQADGQLKSARTDKRVVLEQTAARLIVLARSR